LNLLRKLIETHGVPGREKDIRAVIRDYVIQRNLFDELRTDALGSLIGYRSSRATERNDQPLRVLVTAHMDQIGFVVAHIGEGGFLRLHPVGAFDTRTLFARHVLVYTQHAGTLAGILSHEGRPIHTAKSDELKTIPDLDGFFVDLGLPESDIRNTVSLGDMVVFSDGYREIGEFVSGPGLDNRIGCWALIRAVECLSENRCDIYAAWTVQEEVGSRGAEPVAFGIAADIGIACDTTVCCDIPNIPSHSHITTAGKGVSIQIADSSTLSDLDLVSEVEGIAKTNNIKTQRSCLIGGGQDGALLQVSRNGVRTMVLSAPVRYLHTSTEMAHRDDLFSYRDLLFRVLESL
jgi:tetrahedral aminopeptidase